MGICLCSSKEPTLPGSLLWGHPHSVSSSTPILSANSNDLTGSQGKLCWNCSLDHHWNVGGGVLPREGLSVTLVLHTHKHTHPLYACASCCCDKHRNQKQLREARVHLVYTSSSQSIPEGSQAGPQTGTGAGTMEEHCILACSA